MLIMGLLIGLISVATISGDRGRLQIEAERLARLLELADTESRVTGKSIGWTTDGQVYRFWRIREGTAWTEIRDSDFLRMRTLPDGMLISDLRVETTIRQDKMRMEFSPFRPRPAFAIEMSLGNERHAVMGSPVGEVRVVPGTGGGHGDVAPQ